MRYPGHHLLTTIIHVVVDIFLLMALAIFLLIISPLSFHPLSSFPGHVIVNLPKISLGHHGCCTCLFLDAAKSAQNIYAVSVEPKTDVEKG